MEINPDQVEIELAGKFIEWYDKNYPGDKPDESEYYYDLMAAFLHGAAEGVAVASRHVDNGASVLDHLANEGQKYDRGV